MKPPHCHLAWRAFYSLFILIICDIIKTLKAKETIMKLTPEYIIEQFYTSGKKHLIITGWRGKGKTTLFNKIVNILAEGKTLPGLTSYMIPKHSVMLRDNISQKEAAVGIYCPEKAEIGKNMIPYSDGYCGYSCDGICTAR